MFFLFCVAFCLFFVLFSFCSFFPLFHIFFFFLGGGNLKNDIPKSSYIYIYKSRKAMTLLDVKPQAKHGPFRVMGREEKNKSAWDRIQSVNHCSTKGGPKRRVSDPGRLRLRDRKHQNRLRRLFAAREWPAKVCPLLQIPLDPRTWV